MDGTLYMILMLSAALIHEGAHVLSFVLFKAQIDELKFQPFGIQIKVKNHIQLDYRKEVLTALSGPFINILIAVVMFVYGLYFKTPGGFGFFLVCNLALFFLNIMPIIPLDGGRALHALLLSKTDIYTADKISLRLSAALLIPILILGFHILSVSEYNFSLILIALYLLIGLFKKYRELG